MKKNRNKRFSKITRRFKDASVRTKLGVLVIGSLILMFMASIYMYYNINRLSRKIDNIYVGNVRLNKIEETLDKIQVSWTEYLNTNDHDKSTEYYSYRLDYEKLIDNLNGDIKDDKLSLMERNIRCLSDEYLELTTVTAGARKGKAVKRYRTLYEQTEQMYGYIKSYISSLNNRMFKDNAETYGALVSAIRFLEVASILIFVLLAVFDVFVVLFITRNITKPLHELAKAADKVSEGKLDNADAVNVYAMDEVGVVTVAFNQMVSSIPRYLDRLKDSLEQERKLKEKELLMEASLKEAHLKVLQAQINPHFLFNTLNAGAQLAMLEKADRTYEYVQNVASFYRYNISANDEVKLSEEMKIVDTYIFILNVRFSGEIQYHKDIESEEYLDVKLPCMVLQPIVENCINHGIRDIEREGHIYISVYKEDDYICINIADNGKGIEQSVIDKIMNGTITDAEGDSIIVETDTASEKVKKEDKKGNGLGLRNVIERLDLYYNGKNKFEIFSNGKDQGTEFIISIPYKTMLEN